ncbi:MAG: IS1595 family transposase [Thermoplasmata archaeon]|nr:IS1595 family transposase [Thermoplasmata archaeon]
MGRTMTGTEITSIVDDVSRTVNAVPADRRGALLMELRRLIDSEILGLSRNIPALACPGCGSESFVKHGTTATGIQRYRCRDCGRTFVQQSCGRLLRNTKLTDGQWYRFAECFVDGDVLSQVVRKCEVCMKTAWFMRHRMMELVYANIPSFEVKDGVRIQTDEIYFEETFKGNQLKAGFKMPRAPYVHGSKGHPVGMTDRKICVLTGINDMGDMFYDVVCRGWYDRESARISLDRNVGKGAIIVTDNHASYIRNLREMGIVHEYHPASEHGPLNRVNALHRRIRAFLRPFNGVSTKYLAKYLGWFKWLEAFRGDDSVGSAASQIATGGYDTLWRDVRNIPFPFRDADGNPTKF